MFVAFTINTTMLFLERKKVEDALDAAVLSASLADVHVKQGKRQRRAHQTITNIKIGYRRQCFPIHFYAGGPIN